MHRLGILLGLVASALLFTACQSPRASAPSTPRSVVRKAAPPEMEPVLDLPPGVYVSPAREGPTDVAFVHTRAFTQTFPANHIGANLAFTANLRMPKLEAVGLTKGGYQLHMRFSNATQEPLHVSLVCVYEGESRAERVIKSVEFPVNTYRDIVMDLEGDPGRKLNIRANADPVL